MNLVLSVTWRGRISAGRRRVDEMQGSSELVGNRSPGRSNERSDSRRCAMSSFIGEPHDSIRSGGGNHKLSVCEHRLLVGAALAAPQPGDECLGADEACVQRDQFLAGQKTELSTNCNQVLEKASWNESSHSRCFPIDV